MHFQKLENWWLSVSIRRKMMMFMGIVVVMVLFITLFSISMVGVYMRDFNIVLGDSYAVNAMFNNFGEEHAAFKAYADDRSDDSREIYEAERKETESCLKSLRFDYQQMGAHRYLLTQAIIVSHRSYIANSDRVLRMAKESEAYIEKYYYTLKIGDYLDGYIKELMQITLAQGYQNYYKKVQMFRILPVIAVTLGLILIAFAGLLCTITVRHIIDPVLKLASTSREITANHPDVPDVEVANRDEIGELVHTFNAMKRSTEHAITTLQEKSEIESRLHLEEMHRINTEKAMKTMQMSLLQSQINPHFLFNTLNTISRMARIEGAGCTEELIQRLANLFRYNLQTTSERVPLTRELNIINDYIYIQHKRFGNRIVFAIDCNVDADAFLVPTFTLQPLVENAVIHGVAPKETGGRIRVRIRERADCIVITVTDSGQGMPPDRLNALMSGEGVHKGHLSGIGVGNVRTRVEILYAGSRFRIFSRVGLGTAVRMELPKGMQETANPQGVTEEKDV